MKHRDKQPFTLTLTPRARLETPVCLTLFLDRARNSENKERTSINRSSNIPLFLHMQFDFLFYFFSKDEKKKASGDRKKQNLLYCKEEDCSPENRMRTVNVEMMEDAGGRRMSSKNTSMTSLLDLEWTSCKYLEDAAGRVTPSAHNSKCTTYGWTNGTNVEVLGLPRCSGNVPSSTRRLCIWLTVCTCHMDL